MHVPTPPHEAPPKHNVRAVLQERGLRRLLGVRLISQMGDGFFQAGLAGSVLFNPDQAASPLDIAAGFAVLLLPYALIGPYVGVFLDRWSRRSILFVANTLRAVAAVGAAALIYVGNEGPLFLLAAFLITGINRFFLAGLSASVPHVVEDRRLVTANALSGTLGAIASAVGLGIAVLSLQWLVTPSFHGYGVIAGVSVVTYAASATLARLSFDHMELGPDLQEHPREPLMAELAHSGREMVWGLQHLVSHGGALYALLAQAARRVLFGVVSLSTILLYRGAVDINQPGSMSYIVVALLAASSLGVLGAAAITPPLTRRLGGWRWIVILLVFEGIVVFITGVLAQPLLLAVGAFAVNFAAQGLKIVVDTDLQHEIADEYRGRVFSVNDTAFNVAFVIGLFVAAYFMPPSGRSVTGLTVLLAGFLLVAAWYAAVGGRWARRVGDDIAEPQRSAVAVPA